MVSDKIAIRLSTFNIILLIAGYPFITSVLGSVVSQRELSQAITVPFRFFEMAVSIATILVNLKNKIVCDRTVKALFLFWFCLIIRFVVFFYVEDGNNAPTDYLTRIWSFMIGLTLVPMLAILKSYRKINLDTSYKWVYILYAISIFFTFFSSNAFQEVSEERLRGNFAMGTIEVGHVGLSALVLSMWSLLRTKNKKEKLIICFIGLLAFLIFLRSGSRGPILAFATIVCLVLLSITKSKIRNFMIIGIVICLFFIFYQNIVHFVGEISPLLKERLFDNENQLNSRDYSYDFAIKQFIDNPILGNQFSIPLLGTYVYSHNIFLDTGMQLGIFGLLLLCMILLKSIKESARLITEKKSNLWIGLLFMQYFAKLLVSGAIYTEPLFSILIVLLLSKKRNPRLR